jgi:hypothetical protein
MRTRSWVVFELTEPTQAQLCFCADEWNTPIWEKFKTVLNIPKISQLKSLSNHMLHYQNENSFSLGKSISEVIILINSEDLWGKWLSIRHKYISNGLIHPQMNQQGNSFSFLKHCPDHHTQKTCINSLESLFHDKQCRHRKMKRLCGRTDVTQV